MYPHLQSQRSPTWAAGSLLLPASWHASISSLHWLQHSSVADVMEDTSGANIHLATVTDYSSNHHINYWLYTVLMKYWLNSILYLAQTSAPLMGGGERRRPISRESWLMRRLHLQLHTRYQCWDEHLFTSSGCLHTREVNVGLWRRTFRWLVSRTRRPYCSGGCSPSPIRWTLQRQDIHQSYRTTLARRPPRKTIRWSTFYGRLSDVGLW